MVHTGDNVESYRSGSLVRYLKPITIITFLPGSSDTTDGDTNVKLLLKNLSPNLDLHISSTVIGAEGAPVRPFFYPLAPGTMQLYPITNFPDAPKGYLRPVFQDPAAASPHNNNPLPQTIPFGWEGRTLGDEVEIEIVCPFLSWVGTAIAGQLVVQVSVSYDGAWQNVEALKFSLSRVQLIGLSNPKRIGTAGG